jgi:uncharacterized damage-inducible protein DinB
VEAFELNTAHTAAVIACVPGEFWDRVPGGSAATLRAQLLHLALVRESICRQVAGEPTAGLGATFEGPEWTTDPVAAFAAHAARCRALLARVDWAALDAPFVTPFGNRSTARNYLRCMLVEEVHHRAQMTGLLRLFGVEPPPFPGREWVELGVPQEHP